MRSLYSEIRILYGFFFGLWANLFPILFLIISNGFQLHKHTSTCNGIPNTQIKAAQNCFVFRGIVLGKITWLISSVLITINFQSILFFFCIVAKRLQLNGQILVVIKCLRCLVGGIVVIDSAAEKRLAWQRENKIENEFLLLIFNRSFIV